MKIGILTFHRSSNYGAILQALALTKAIHKIGINAEIIDYRCEVLENNRMPIIIYKGVTLKEIISSTIHFFVRKKKNNNFKSFIDKHVDISEKVYFNHDDLLRANQLYDLFITGSDQVWNYNLTRFDKAYFLDFVAENHKKNSYAASFGFSTLPEKFNSTYTNLISTFNNISVRELSGNKIINKLIDMNVPIMMDPVFLLSRDEWNQYSSQTKYEDYILVYTVKKSNDLLLYANELSKKYKCKVIYISDKIIPKSNMKYIRGCSPSTFLGLIRDAKYIVTNSFHGVAFSIIYNKQFQVEIPNATGTRIESLLNSLNLNNRIIKKQNNMDNFHQCKEIINYSNINKIIALKKAESVEFLKHMAECVDNIGDKYDKRN